MYDTIKHNKTVKRSNKTHKHNKNNVIKGGEVIGSGGYGCVFSPALKCKNQTRNKKYIHSHITKLMVKKYAVKEFNEMGG